MNFMKRHGFQVISFDDLVQALKKASSSPAILLSCNLMTAMKTIINMLFPFLKNMAFRRWYF